MNFVKRSAPVDCADDSLELVCAGVLNTGFEVDEFDDGDDVDDEA